MQLTNNVNELTNKIIRIVKEEKDKFEKEVSKNSSIKIALK